MLGTGRTRLVRGHDVDRNAARAQQLPAPVIGFLSSGSAEARAALTAAFRRGLSETGYIEGQNIAIEFRWAEDRYDRLPALAADLVRRYVAVLVATGGSLAVQAAKGATSSSATSWSTTTCLGTR